MNLGAGKQSTVLSLTEKYDTAIFADTQEEPQWVYQNLGWIASKAQAPIVTRSIGKLGDHLQNGVNSSGGRFAPIPAFTSSGNGSPSMIRRQCTSEYKTMTDAAILATAPPDTFRERLSRR